MLRSRHDSRDSEVRGFLMDGNSVVLTDRVVAAESDGVGYMGDLGVGWLSLSTADSCFSTDGATMGGAVIERSGTVRSAAAGETLSLVAFAVDSEVTVDIGLGCAKL